MQLVMYFIMTVQDYAQLTRQFKLTNTSPFYYKSWLFVNPEAELVRSAIGENIDIIQFHGSETPDFVLHLISFY